MNKWLRTGLLSLWVTVPLAILGAIANGMKGFFGGPGFSWDQVPLALAVYFIFIILPVFIIVALISYLRNR